MHHPYSVGIMDQISLPKMSVRYASNLLDVSLQAIHKQMKQKNVSLPKLGNKSYLDHDIGKKLFMIPFKKKKIAFQIVKGGTGKTTSLYNISCAASLYGAKILTIDLDPQGNLTDSFNVNPESVPIVIDVFEGHASTEESIISVSKGIDLLPSRIENIVLDNKLALSKVPLHTFFSNMISEVENNYDFILIDCPPTMGHSVSAASLYVDSILVPLNPDRFSAKGLKILKHELKNLQKAYRKNISYKVFLNKYSNNTILSDKAIQTTISSEIETNNALKTAIRVSQEIPNTSDKNQNVFSTLKKLAIRDDFDLLTRELLNIDVSRVKGSRYCPLTEEEEMNNAIN